MANARRGNHNSSTLSRNLSLTMKEAKVLISELTARLDAYKLSNHERDTQQIHTIQAILRRLDA